MAKAAPIYHGANDVEVTGRRRRGRPKKGWQHCVHLGMETLELTCEMDQDRAVWRSKLAAATPYGEDSRDDEFVYVFNQTWRETYEITQRLGTYCLLSFPNLTTCHLSSLSKINKLDLISLSSQPFIFFFFHGWCFV